MKPQQDGRWEKNCTKIKFNSLIGWAAHKLENNCIVKVLLWRKVLSSHVSFPAWDSSNGWGVPREPDFEMPVWLETPLQGWYTQSLVHEDIEGNVMIPQESGPDLPPYIEESLTELAQLKIIVGTKTLAAAVLGSSHWHKHSWRRPSLISPINSLVDSSSGSPQGSQSKRNTDSTY